MPENGQMEMGNYSQAYIDALLKQAWWSAQSQIEAANISASASRYRADIDKFVAEMEMRYSYMRLYALEIPEMRLADARARHQIALQAATTLAELSGFYNPLDFDTRRILTDSLDNLGYKINRSPVNARQFLEQPQMSDAMANAKAAGWSDADPEAILSAWVQSNKDNAAAAPLLKDAQAIVDSTMKITRANAERGDLYSQQKMVSTIYYIQQMGASPINQNVQATKQALRSTIDQFVRVPQTTTNMVPISQSKQQTAPTVPSVAQAAPVPQQVQGAPMPMVGQQGTPPMPMVQQQGMSPAPMPQAPSFLTAEKAPQGGLLKWER